MITRMRDRVVLVGVLKGKRDLEILRREHWYRIPAARIPGRRFTHLAFYQPAIFGREGKSMRYYARVRQSRTLLRKELLPRERTHPNAGEYYVRLRVGAIKRLARPIKNILPRRVSFGFTTLRQLRAAKNILQVYGVAETESMIQAALRRAGIPNVAQYYVSDGRKRYRLDFAVFCKKGRIALECDNRKAHSGARQVEKDRVKDAFLRARGWRVMRLKEDRIISDPDSCARGVRRAVRLLGGADGTMRAADASVLRKRKNSHA